MRLISVATIAWSLLPLAASAEDADDTLRFLFSKSEVVVWGTIKTEPVGEAGEPGVSNYICEFAVADVAKGDAELKGKAIKINIIRSELNDEDRFRPIAPKFAAYVLQTPEADRTGRVFNPIRKLAATRVTRAAGNSGRKLPGQDSNLE